jgi:hypothetical protein
MNIDKVIAINLEEEVFRKEHILKVMGSISTNFELIKAIATPITNAISLNPKLLGQGISHCIALSKVEGITLILEDDAVINLEALNNLEVPEDWQLIALCCSIKKRAQHIKNNIYRVPKETVVTAAYIVRNSLVATNIINFWLKNLNSPVPNCVFDYSIYEGIVEGAYCTYPMVASVLTGKTTVWEGNRDNTSVMEKSWRKIR